MIRAATFSAAAWAASGSTEVYVSAVSTMLEWPSISCTTFSSTPADKLVESSVPTMLNEPGFRWSPGGIRQGW
jgi:hypothetical protein